MTDTHVQQTVFGHHNIFSATGDVYHAVYQLTPAEGQDRSNQLILLNKVRQFWVQGVLEQSVHHAVLLELCKETRPQEVEHPWDMDLEVPGRDKPQRLAPGTKISGVFEQTGRLLLILGEPGSGKTISLLELARDLLNQAEHDPTQPIPVVFNLSSWAEKRAPLKDWLVEELKSKYLIPKKIARDWLDNLRILPLLDGLDEVKAEHRAACLGAINTFAEEGIPGMAVCSRLQEYLALPRRLKLNGAICLQALTQAQIDAYLENAGEGSEALHKLLQEDEGLRELSQTPLMLNIMVMAYHGMPVDEVQAQKVESLDARRRALFDLYVEKMFARKGNRKMPYSKEQIIKNLSWLSAKMKEHQKSIFFLEEMQPSWITKNGFLLLYYIMSRVLSVVPIMSLSIGVIYVIDIMKNQINDNYLYAIAAIFLCSLFGLPIGLVDYIFRKFEKNKFYITFLINFIVITGLSLGYGAVSYPYDLEKFHEFRIAFNTGEIPKDAEDRELMIEHGVNVILVIMYGMIGFIFSLIFGLIFFIRSHERSVFNDIQIHTTIQLKFTSSFDNIYRGAKFGFFMSIIFLVLTITTQSIDIDTMLEVVFIVLVSIIISFLSGVVSYKNSKIRKNFLSSSVLNTLYSIVLFGVVFIPILLISDERFSSSVLAFIFIGIIMKYGVLDIVNHYTLRIILAVTGLFPIEKESLLSYACIVNILQPIGDDYIFIHRYLLEHFATLYEESQNAKKSQP